jgi:hypothetical protein
MMIGRTLSVGGTIMNHCQTSSRVTPLSISAAGCSDKEHVRENNEDAIAGCAHRIHFEQSNCAHCIGWLMVQEATQQARLPAESLLRQFPLSITVRPLLTSQWNRSIFGLDLASFFSEMKYHRLFQECRIEL